MQRVIMILFCLMVILFSCVSQEDQKKFEAIPQSDQEVIAQFEAQYSEDLQRLLIGIFHARRGMGDDVLTAYHYTLQAHLDAVEKAQGQ